MPPKDASKDAKPVDTKPAAPTKPAVAPKEAKPNPLIATVKIAIAVVGIFGSFGYFAILQEDLFKKPYGMDAKGKGGEKFKSTFFMMVAERGVNSLVALVFLLVGGGSECKLPIKEIALSGGTQMFAMAASNEALKFVSYPTQVLGKSCKMVPVFLMDMMIGGKKYEWSMYFQVAVVTAGVVVFNFGAPVKAGKGGGADSSYGLGLIAFSLFLDGLTGGLQTKVKKSTAEMNKDKKGAKLSMFESMLYTNLAGAVIALLLAAATGQISEGMAFCKKGGEPFVQALLAYSVCSALGQCFIYFTITEFGALLVSTVTTTRKIFSTVYSVFRNPDNSLNEMQWTGCGLVFFGILFEMAAGMLSGKEKSH